MNHKGHNAADAAHKGVHKKIKTFCVLCVFVVRFVLSVLRNMLTFFLVEKKRGDWYEMG
jgi:hypothetical protein